MKKLFTVTLLTLAAFLPVAKAQLSHDKCLSEIMFQEAAAKDPQVQKNRENLEKFTEAYSHSNASSRNAGTTKIIPVVVHVMHYGGPENISDAQILDQIRVLNEDYRRLNADTVNTPAVFKPLGADVGIEFRMAQLDPNGNCTNGIERIYTPLTFNARNNVKPLSCWPRDKYLNMWIVSSIANTNGSPGTVIGFAQFPGGADSTDGVVIKYDYMGTIGAAASTGGAGRTATHEVGHWLNLRHIWGDATCGNDFVTDTPTQESANLSTCPSWPHVTNCSGNSPNGDMFTNYMDYTNGPCQNMFSIGQSQRMNATLASTLSGRNNLWSSANLIATGTDGTPAVTCAPHADFIPRPLFICEGTSIQFTDGSWGGPVDSRVWTFTGGSPATDTSANPTVQYLTAGVYDVSLSVTNTAGTTTKTITGKVVVSASGNSISPIGFSEGFENGTWPFNDYYAINANGGTTWQTTSIAANGGTKSIYISNTYNSTTESQSNDKGPDDFITPMFDFTNITNPTMTFDIACALRDTTLDRFVVYYSTNCGQTWTLRKAIQGLPLQTTTGFVTGNFIPNSSQWRNETVSFGNNVANKPNVRFRIEFNHESSNNLYLDNINLNGTVGLSEDLNVENAGMNIHPNPSKGVTYVDFSMLAQSDVKIEVLDIQGRIVSTFSDNLSAGDHQYQFNNNLEAGVYMVRLSFGDRAITKKVVIR